MDSKYTAEMLKHLEKQREILMDAYRSMSHELHRLQHLCDLKVEEEMLMRKFYELMSAHGVLKEDANRENALNDRESSPSNCDTNSQI